MRTIMEKTKPLFEMPYLTTTEEDFFLPNQDYNRKQAHRLLATSYHVLEKNDLIVLGDYQNGDQGEIFLYRHDLDLITYFVRYEIKQVEPFGRCVTQVALWRSADPGIEGVAKMVFETYLLQHFDAIISDSMQTRDGQRFWVGRMGVAAREGKSVGIIVNGEYHPYDRSMSLEDWIGHHDAWGQDDSHEGKLFVITNRAPARRASQDTNSL